MPFDPILGVGRDPSFLYSTYGTEATIAGQELGLFAGDTEKSITITLPQTIRVESFNVIAGIFSSNVSNGITFQVYVNEVIVLSGNTTADLVPVTVFNQPISLGSGFILQRGDTLRLRALLNGTLTGAQQIRCTGSLSVVGVSV